MAFEVLAERPVAAIGGRGRGITPETMAFLETVNGGCVRMAAGDDIRTFINRFTAAAARNSLRMRMKTEGGFVHFWAEQTGVK